MVDDKPPIFFYHVSALVTVNGQMHWISMQIESVFVINSHERYQTFITNAMQGVRYLISQQTKEAGIIQNVTWISINLLNPGDSNG